jgi:hypothetical protein
MSWISGSLLILAAVVASWSTKLDGNQEEGQPIGGGGGEAEAEARSVRTVNA